MNKLKDYYNFGKFVLSQKTELWKNYEKTKKHNAMVVKMNEYVDHLDRTCRKEHNIPLKNWDERLNPYKYAGSIDRNKLTKIAEESSPNSRRSDTVTEGTMSMGPVVAAVVASEIFSSDTASASSPVDTFSAGGGDFSGGGADSSY